ncbi:Mitochondrial ubiquitin ligase activator of nfkb 1 [Glycine soja]|nr:Mitochondrial ubiquitin ligase activator of nfkb 1 [Glycine soja]
MDGSRHPLPLTTVYHKLQPITASPYTFLQALFGHEYPVGLLDEEKILPLGKDITAVGLCSLKNGIAEIKSCKYLPYFLSDLSKDQMIMDLSIKTKILFWGGIALGSMSVGVLGYAVVRNWNKWKQWKQQRQLQQQRQAVSDVEPQMDDEIEDAPDGQLCVICLMRRRRSVFIPCGHLVCCQGCAISVEREVAPKCPVCRQEIRDSVRIYES